MIEINKKEVGDKIRQHRIKAGLKQSSFAELVHLSEKHISKIECGKSYPALDSFFNIIQVLNISLEDFGICIDNKKNNAHKKMITLISNSSEKEIDAYLTLINSFKSAIKTLK